MRNNKGQFLKGHHWREKQDFWNKKFLFNLYWNQKKSIPEIAKIYNCTNANIRFWLQKHDIKRRTVSEARKIKHWGLSGNKNGMYGKVGKLNPRWDGGHSPERQCSYAKAFWKELRKEILKRDNYKCFKCGETHKSKVRLVVHHLRRWSRYPELRFEKSNLITLCEICHKKEHYGH